MTKLRLCFGLLSTGGTGCWCGAASGGGGVIECCKRAAILELGLLARLKVAAERIASSLSILAIRSIVVLERISSISCIDSVRLGGSELLGENVPLPAVPVPVPGSELSDGTLSMLW
uniref:Secreted protein n=1 Tax=Anopheles merus TaxID=30066 RepID=A0A182VCS4_ANOME